ncbi:MAG: cupin domain-containing protein [Spirochaetia bacterium]
MINRASELIRRLGLKPHPEGGYYGEVYRAHQKVITEGKTERTALTTIFFLLAAGQKSAWHRVTGEEVWHYYEGDPLELYQADPDLKSHSVSRIGPTGDDVRPAAVVPGGYWQAARTTGDYTLAGCTVGPGFEFEDFMLLRDDPEKSTRFFTRYPETKEFL